MKSMHDYQGEVRAARKRMRRAWRDERGGYGKLHVVWLDKHVAYFAASEQRAQKLGK